MPSHAPLPSHPRRGPPLADFVGRHVGPDANDIAEMLAVIVGQPSLDAMRDRAIPGAIRSPTR